MRRGAAGIPAAIGYATKPQLGCGMLGRAFKAGYRPAWVTADEVYGRAGYLRHCLEERQQAYVVAIACDTPVWKEGAKRTPRDVMDGLRPDEWERLSCGEGSKGPRIYEWAWTEVTAPTEPSGASESRHRLMCRRPVGSSKPQETA